MREVFTVHNDLREKNKVVVVKEKDKSEVKAKGLNYTAVVANHDGDVVRTPRADQSVCERGVNCERGVVCGLHAMGVVCWLIDCACCVVRCACDIYGVVSFGLYACDMVWCLVV